MPHPSLAHIFDNMPPWWSDHAYQSMSVSVNNPETNLPIYSVCVGSWNTLNRCHSVEKGGKGFHNNPFNHDEIDDAEYILRKMAQINKLEEKIRNGGDDIVFLQEELNEMLKKHRYAMTTTVSIPSDPIYQQQLATLYNTKKLQLVKTPLDEPCGVFPATRSGGYNQFRGYETTFTIIDAGPLNGKKLVATNLHLQFNFDCKDAIEEYQCDMETRDVLHIMGGDTNSIQDAMIINALGNSSLATLFNETFDTPPTLTITRKDGMKKSCDSFFIVPPNNFYMTAQSVAERSEFIEIDSQGFIEYKPNTNAEKYESRVSQRWRRSDATLEEQDEYFAENSYGFFYKPNSDKGARGSPANDSAVALDECEMSRPLDKLTYDLGEKENYAIHFPSLASLSSKTNTKCTLRSTI